MNKSLENYTNEQLEQELKEREIKHKKELADQWHNENVRVAKHYILSQGNLKEIDLAKCNDNTILYLESKIKQCISLNEQLVNTCKELAQLMDKVEMLPKKYRKLFE